MIITALRKVFALDALSCIAFFAACVPLAGFVSGIVGLPRGAVAAGGWICLAAGLLFAALALTQPPSHRLVALGILGNALWVAASLAIVAGFAQQMSVAGIGLVLAQAFAVGGAAPLRQPPGGVCHLPVPGRT